MRQFDESIKRLKEIHCWKGYRKVGTKMKSGKRVNDCRPIKENYFPAYTDFTKLPDSPPYGFWVYNKKFIIANQMDDHKKILREIMPSEYQSLSDGPLETRAFSMGLVRMVKSFNRSTGKRIYYLNYVRGSIDAIKTAKDIALHYNIDTEDDFTPSSGTSPLASSPDNAL